MFVRQLIVWVCLCAGAYCASVGYAMIGVIIGYFSGVWYGMYLQRERR